MPPVDPKIAESLRKSVFAGDCQRRWTPASEAAIVPFPGGDALAVAIDTLVAGVHFPSNASPEDIGYKALAVNLSDLAAVGATPRWSAVSIITPTLDKAWQQAFTTGYQRLADAYGLQTPAVCCSRGSTAVTVQAYGHLPPDAMLRRSGAQLGDRIFVTGTLGDAGLALAYLQGDIGLDEKSKTQVLERLARPVPRLKVGLELRGIASAAIDVSDGLAADLMHILVASGVGASLDLAQLPLSPTLKKHLAQEQAWHLALSSGDDYELCFTVPPTKESILSRAANRLDCPITCIGQIDLHSGLRCLGPSGSLLDCPSSGYQHFSRL